MKEEQHKGDVKRKFLLMQMDSILCDEECNL